MQTRFTARQLEKTIVAASETAAATAKRHRNDRAIRRERIAVLPLRLSSVWNIITAELAD